MTTSDFSIEPVSRKTSDPSHERVSCFPWLDVFGSIVRLVLVILIGGGLGLFVGVVVGINRAQAEVAAPPPPPAKPTLGMETSGLAEIMIWAINLVIWGGLGCVIGASIGIVLMILMTVTEYWRTRLSDL